MQLTPTCTRCQISAVIDRDSAQLRCEIETAAARVRQLDWDVDEPVEWVTESDLERVLTRYIAGELPSASVLVWADALEMRGDVGFEGVRAERMFDIVIALATPDIEPLSIELARRMLAQIRD